MTKTSLSSSRSSFFQQQLQQVIYILSRVGPEEFALYLGNILASNSFVQAQQQLQQLHEMFSTLAISTRGFKLDSEWKHRETKASIPYPYAQNETTTRLLSVIEVAEKLNFSKAQIYKFIKSKQLKANSYGSKNKATYRISQSDLLEFQASRTKQTL